MVCRILAGGYDRLSLRDFVCAAAAGQMTDTLPPDFPRDLADMLGIKPERPALPALAPITQAIRDALKAAHDAKGKCI